MYIPQLAQLTDFALLAMRLLLALIFIWSGVARLRNPSELGLPIPLTLFVAAAEVAGGLGLAFGVLTQWAALGLIVIMLGAIATKLIKWKIGFWGKENGGWSYEVTMIVMLLVVACLDGGRWVLRA